MSRAHPVQIVGSYLSPYVRKVLVVLDLKGIPYEIPSSHSSPTSALGAEPDPPHPVLIDISWPGRSRATAL